MRTTSAGEVFVVILNWNGSADTIECLDSLTRGLYRCLRAVVVDNGSRDDSVARIEAWAAARAHLVSYTRAEAEAGGRVAEERALREEPSTFAVVLIRADENLGFSAGCNVGIRYAMAAQAEYVLLLNNDTIATPQALSRMVGFLEEHPDYVGVTAQLRLNDRPLTWNCGGELTWWGGRRYFFFRHPVAATPQTGWRRISFMTGCAAMMRTSAFAQLGPLSERFFFGEEDYELCVRLKRAGERIACCFDAVIYHKLGRSIDRAAAEGNLGRYYILYLSRFIDMRGFYPRPLWLLWRYASLAIVLRRLRRSFSVPWRSLHLLAHRLLHDSTVLDVVSRDRFEAATKLGLEAL
jgi:GT2 family glycosyltransferase